MQADVQQWRLVDKCRQENTGGVGGHVGAVLKKHLLKRMVVNSGLSQLIFFFVAFSCAEGGPAVEISQIVSSLLQFVQAKAHECLAGQASKRLGECAAQNLEGLSQSWCSSAAPQFVHITRLPGLLSPLNSEIYSYRPPLYGNAR